MQQSNALYDELKTLSDTEGEIVFTGTIDKGWHVYSLQDNKMNYSQESAELDC